MKLFPTLSAFLLLQLAGCSSPFSPQSPPTPIPDPPALPVERPPGSAEEDASSNIAKLLKTAEAFEANRRPVEAFRSYRAALSQLPPDYPEPDRQKLQQKVTHLSFLLGVPEGTDSASPPIRPATDAVPENLLRARAIQQEALKAEAAGRAVEAIALNKEIISLISEKDDKDLYWTSWQKIEDLSPEGTGPSTVAEKADPEEEDGSNGVAVENQEGVPGAIPSAQDARAADANLGKARAAYMKGLEYARAQDKVLAKQAFTDVLTLIRESQDPELYRAARQNLADLKAPPPK